MLQKGIQLLNFSQNKKQSTYDTATNYDNFKIITCANTHGIINGFVTLFAPPGRGFVATLLNFCSCTQDSFVLVLTPGHPDASSGRSGQARICEQLNSNTP